MNDEEILSGKDIEVPSYLKEWLSQPKKNYWNGIFHESRNTFTTENPATGDKLAEIALAEKEEVDAAVISASSAFDKGEWANAPLEKRAATIKRLGDLILEHRAPLAILESLDTGKPIRESFEGDIPRAAKNFHFFADFALSENPLVYDTPDALHESHREALGVVALITPWNLPLYLESWKMAPCLLMGNSCVLKASECSPLTAAYFTEKILPHVDLPIGVFNLLHGFGEKGAGEYLVSHPLVSAISFTGETSTGRAIMKSAAPNLSRVSFELGGKGASVVFADADLEKALEGSLRGAFRNQGEVCLACSRLYVHDSQYNSFVDSFVKRAKEIKVGNPLNSNTQMGALISREHFQKVESFMHLVEYPARITCGGKRAEGMEKGNFFAPTVIEGLTDDHPITQKEIFGPVVSIYPFSTEEQVVQAVNSTPYGLSASVWTKDEKRQKRLSRAIKTGMLWFNCWFVRDLRVPFGGQKKSGVGREGGSHSFDFFSEWKSVCRQKELSV